MNIFIIIYIYSELIFQSIYKSWQTWDYDFTLLTKKNNFFENFFSPIDNNLYFTLTILQPC